MRLTINGSRASPLTFFFSLFSLPLFLSDFLSLSFSFFVLAIPATDHLHGVASVGAK